MGLLPCPLPCQQDSDQSNPKSLYSDSSSSSSKSFSSLASQPSLPSVPSLTASISCLIEQPSSKTSHHCLATLKGGCSYIFCLSLAGKHLYCGSSNGDILVSGRDPSQDENSESALRLVARSGTAVKSIVILGDKLISAHQDHRIRVWKIENELTHHHHHQRKHHYYKCIATLPTLNDRCMKLLSAKNYVEVRRHKKCTWVHHVDTVSAMALSPDGALLYSVSWDRTLKLWRTSDFKCLQSIWNAHDDAVNAVTLSPDGHVYTGSADKKIKVWKRHVGHKTHTLVATLEKHKSTVNALALSPDGSVLYSGACDRSIIVWEKDGGACGGACGGAGSMAVVGALRGHKKAILSLAVVGGLVVSGSADKMVRMWKRGFGKSYFCVGVLEGHNGPVKCLTASLDKNDESTKDDGERNCGNSYMVYSGGLDCDVKVWKIWVPNV